MTFVTRFAPSPTGRLHRGHAFSALTAFEAARARSGHFLLRMEDIDIVRCRPEFDAGILEDLAWLGLSWEGPVRRQSEHMADYQAALDDLRARGLLYRCFRTRRDILEDIGRAPHGPGEGWRGAPLPPDEEDRRLAAGDPFAWRLSLTAAETALGGFGSLTWTEAGDGAATGVHPVDPWPAGDIVLARKDVGVAYHLAVVVDDALQGITDVIRGADLVEATPVQRVLQALLGLPAPAYRHHRLLTGPDGRRYAKRDRSETLQALREAGRTAAEVRAELGFAA